MAFAGLAAVLAYSLTLSMSPVEVNASDVPPPDDRPGLRDSLPTERRPGDPWCHYPLPKVAKQARVLARQKQTIILSEVEPNDDPGIAQLINASSDIGEEVDVDIRGNITPGADLDHFQFFALAGDVVGLVVEADVPADLGQDALDPVVEILALDGEVLTGNDDDNFASSLYPTASPMPRATRFLDPAMTYVIPNGGEYVIRVSSFASSRNGPYTLRVRLRRPGFESKNVSATQVIFLDFDGAVGVNAAGSFGFGFFAADLSPLRNFLFNWGLGLEDEADVVQAILDVVNENFDDLRTSGINGDRPSDRIDGSFDVEFLNSRDHPDPFGQPNTSRVIVGGTVFELGIGTLGIAESIDPGNYAGEETAVVLLDSLSGPTTLTFLVDEGDPDDPDDDEFITVVNIDSINTVPVAAGSSIVDLIGRVVGNIVSHEIGHYLGLWHTDNTNQVQCLIDAGGDGIFDEAGVGSDGIFGTADDADVDFFPDIYDLSENFFGGFFGIENTDVRIAHALSTGTIRGVVEPPAPEPGPSASIRATPTVGTAPVEVNFAAGGIDPNGNPFTSFTWDFGDGTGDNGPSVTHTYVRGGTYIATLTATTVSLQTGSATVQIRVFDEDNVLPLVEIRATPSTGTAPLTVILEGTASDPDGVIVQYDWIFGDGSTGVGQVVEHTFLDAGTYGVTLTVTDDRGVTATSVEPIIATLSSDQTTTAGFTADPNNQPTTETDGQQPGGCGSGVAWVLMVSFALLMALTAIRRRY